MIHGTRRPDETGRPGRGFVTLTMSEIEGAILHAALRQARSRRATPCFAPPASGVIRDLVEVLDQLMLEDVKRKR